MQSLSNDEYLIQTVGPILYQGLNLLVKERPKNPHECLAVYLLKNQDNVQIPTKPTAQIETEQEDQKSEIPETPEEVKEEN